MGAVVGGKLLGSIVADGTTAILHYANGAIGSFVNSRRAPRRVISLEIVSDEAALERALSDAADLVIVPTVATRARLLYPFANWTSLRDARRLRRRGRAVTTLPFAA